MKKFCTLLCISFFSLQISSAQNPLVKQWDTRFGGTKGDSPSTIQQTTDGGFIIGGNSNSGIGGDKTQDCRGQRDYWIIRIDSLGNKLWDKRFGTTGFDTFRSLQQTSDGGFILGGESSGLNGDKTQPGWGSSGFLDY